jgi:hypothetical protein
VAIIEVQRLWMRFCQLDGESGYIPEDSLDRGELSQSIFIRNVLFFLLLNHLEYKNKSCFIISKIISNLPEEKDGSLSFIVFLKFIQWCDINDNENELKLKGF